MNEKHDIVGTPLEVGGQIFERFCPPAVRAPPDPWSRFGFERSSKESDTVAMAASTSDTGDTSSSDPAPSMRTGAHSTTGCCPPSSAKVAAVA